MSKQSNGNPKWDGNLDIETLRYIYNAHFSSKTNTSQSFEYKIELLTLLAFLTQQLKKRMPDNFKNSYDVLTNRH